VTLLATKVAGLEAELQSSIERAELAEERAANLEVGTCSIWIVLKTKFFSWGV
jgi:hypothetical protein